MRSFQTLSLLCSFISLARAVAINDSFKTRHNSAPGQHRRQQSTCRPFNSTFPQSDVSQDFYTPFIGISPPETYEATGDGLEMFLKKPQGPITRQGHVNSAIGEGATINSTFILQYGKVTFEMKSPKVAGSVTAAILIADGHDEIDVELIAGDPNHWQTNVYAPSPKDMKPLWGIFGQVDDFSSSTSTTSDFHNYTIDWSATRIIWSVDGHEVRTLKPDQTNINGTEHYPTEPSRIQLGIWDASSPEGTSEWAKGPIDWQNTPETISAIIKSVRVECE